MKKSVTRLGAVIMLAVIISAGMCVLPITTIHCGGPEPATIVVRGFNLMNFSCRGIVPILAALITPVSAMGSQSHGAKEAELIFLFMANAVSFLHSFNTAKMWFMEGDKSLITLDFGAVIFPLGFIAVLIITKVFTALYEIIDATCENEIQQNS